MSSCSSSLNRFIFSAVSRSRSEGTKYETSDLCYSGPPRDGRRSADSIVRDRSPIVAYETIPIFSPEDAAQAHCPRDVVVWLNTRTGIWHEKGMRWYGRTEHGAHVCRQEAAKAGYRDTENRQ